MSFDKFRTTSVFRENIKAYNANVDLIVNQGGTRSGKTISILQLLFLIALKHQNDPQQFIISIVSRALPHLKLGAMRDFDNIIQSYGLNLSCKSKTESVYRFGNALIEFFGADQIDKVHGPRRDILYINEANFIKFDIFDMLRVRTEGTIFVDFNPTRKFWAHDEIGKLEKRQYVFIKSTYRDNEMLPEKIKERIEAHKNNPAWWRVYGEGDIGISEGAIFTNWRYAKDGEFPVIHHGFGLDYGFHPDPDALVKVCLDEPNKKYYLQECIYETLQGTKELSDRMLQFCLPYDEITAESASPRTNYDLQKTFKRLHAVQKTKTVAEWLRKMQDYELIISPDSYNLEIELSNYVWSDKKAGVPLDGFNHLIDAGRYRYMKLNKKVWRNW